MGTGVIQRERVEKLGWVTGELCRGFHLVESCVMYSIFFYVCACVEMEARGEPHIQKADDYWLS